MFIYLLILNLNQLCVGLPRSPITVQALDLDILSTTKNLPKNTCYFMHNWLYINMQLVCLKKSMIIMNMFIKKVEEFINDSNL